MPQWHLLIILQSIPPPLIFQSQINNKIGRIIKFRTFFQNFRFKIRNSSISRTKIDNSSFRETAKIVEPGGGGGGGVLKRKGKGFRRGKGREGRGRMKRKEKKKKKGRKKEEKERKEKEKKRKEKKRKEKHGKNRRTGLMKSTNNGSASVGQLFESKNDLLRVVSWKEGREKGVSKGGGDKGEERKEEERKEEERKEEEKIPSNPVVGSSKKRRLFDGGVRTIDINRGRVKGG